MLTTVHDPFDTRIFHRESVALARAGHDVTVVVPHHSCVTRDGVSVFPSFEGLYRYLAEREAETAGYVILELEGELTGDVDLDADAGAVLIRPTRVIGALPFDYARAG